MKVFPLILTGLLCCTAFAELPLTGGHTTTKQTGTAAFSQPAANLPLMKRVDFSVGNSFFRNPWVIAPSSTTARDGLGPLFNTNGCQNCHIRDGRGHAPLDAEDDAMSMLIRLSVTPKTDAERTQQQLYGPLPEPNYGGQLQDRAIPGVDAEGRIEVEWRPREFEYPDGQRVTLRAPDFRITELAYGPFHEEFEQSARIAPQMIGLGLLEQIPEAAILANADPDDANNDGISGRANRVWDVSEQRTVLGRFGWKAGMPTLRQQNAGAFNGDIGITSELFEADDCTTAQMDCRNAPSGDTAPEKELQNDVLDAVTFYTQHLAVPIQRQAQSESVLNGRATFTELGCEACHVSTFSTPVMPTLPALSEQTFHPFTDLLLHDMGEELADHRAEFLADGREWRTPPLWGLGYLMEVNDQIALLHDGRAQSLEAAILWHGGEAKDSRDAFVNLTAKDRQSLLDFLNSL
ncbi:di-heme oxidoredictase family protein [Reinekea blandensis]|uniref:Cytochrome c domain-containing protein n=1 Tax=Reinekea blandensis MED297 TaxID=314283 RepID=A4BG13_9GAMM|nr:di-heme oxidoredictase family protein [Reinekea blandensis]EAR09031.1 hypothetical protein MED297_04042 [Reinekea sp. MED297] [Reinekea blandensis MED297]